MVVRRPAMKPWKDIKIGNKLIFSVILITLIASLLLIGFFVVRVSKSISNEVTNKLMATSEKYAVSFESNLEEVVKITDTLENVFFQKVKGKPYVSSTFEAVLSQMEPIVEALAQNSTQGNTAYIYIDPAITGDPHDVYYADQDGDGLVERQEEVAKAYFTTGPTETESKDWWFGPKESGEGYWTQPYVWRFDNGNSTNFVSYTKPIFFNGRFVGVVGSDLVYDDISEIINSIKIEDEGYAFLVDQDHRVLSSSLEESGLLEAILACKSMTPETSQTYKGTSTCLVTLKDEGMIAATVELENGWLFGISLYEETIFEDLYAIVNMLIVITIGVLALGGYAFYRVGGSITNPIIALVNYVDRIEHGEYQDIEYAKEGHRQDEIGDLRQAIQRMIERIRSNMFYIHNQNLSLKEQIHKNDLMKKKMEIAFNALSSSDDGILIIDKTMNIIFNNQSLLELFNVEAGLLRDELVNLLPADDITLINFKHWQIKRIVDAKNKTFEGLLHEIGSEQDVFLIIFKDITSAVKKEDSLKELKNKDVLTGMLNRYGLEESIVEYLNSSEHAGGFYPLILINIDNFRSINDSLGFQKANSFLKKMANRLQDIFEEDAVIARTNGDEFGVFVKRNLRKKDFEKYIRDAVSKIGDAYDVGEEKVYFTFSAGVSVVGIDATYCNESMNNAHSALNFAKERQEVRLSFFNREMLKNATENYLMIKGLREAIDRRDFEVVYQPKWDVLKQECVGFEALARWKWEGNYISPDVFVKVAEYNNLMLQIGEIIFEKTALFIRTLADEGYTLPISVNVSSIQFNKGYFEEYVFGILKKYDIRPECLKIELTESILMQNREEVNDIISSFKQKGILASIDDFGKGYSSLSYLKDFEVSTLKIDREFIKDIPDKDDGSLARLIVNLGKLLKLEVIAEGVETKVQLDQLASYGCHIIQGYYISKPIAQEDVLNWLEENS